MAFKVCLSVAVERSLRRMVFLAVLEVSANTHIAILGRFGACLEELAMEMPEGEKEIQTEWPCLHLSHSDKQVANSSSSTPDVQVPVMLLKETCSQALQLGNSRTGTARTR